MGVEVALFWNWPSAYLTRWPSSFFFSQIQLLTRTMAFSFKKCVSLNTEKHCVCYFLGRRGIFFTRWTCLIKVDNAVTNGKSKSKRMRQVKVWHVYTLQNSNPLYVDSYACNVFLLCISTISISTGFLPITNLWLPGKWVFIFYFPNYITPCMHGLSCSFQNFVYKITSLTFLLSSAGLKTGSCLLVNPFCPMILAIV